MPASPLRPFLLGLLLGSYVSLLIRYRERMKQPELEGLTKEELYKRAQAAEIPGRSEMTKDELIAALRKHS